MKTVGITGVSRAQKFSPNCENNDSLIFCAVADELRKRGFVVNEVSESDITALASCNDAYCFSMARGGEALAILRKKEEQGMLVVNSASSLLLNHRAAITRAFSLDIIPAPESEVLVNGEMPSMPFPFWLKRGDACAQSCNDVRYVDSNESLRCAIEDFKRRDISCVVANEHLSGDLVKFYGVVGTDFFYTCLPTENGKSGKFGLEQINGEPHRYSYNLRHLHEVCTRAAKLLDFVVYGGDCIVGEDGKFKIIDFNDWPSFSRCRYEAAAAIAEAICAAVLKRQEAEKAAVSLLR